jgi:soluble lytic murein transglycosylase-like protein
MTAAAELPPPIAALLDAAANTHRVDPALARAVAWVESRGNPAAESSAGAQGVMQLMAATAADLGVTDRFDPAQNVDAGVKFLRRLLDKYGGNEQRALAAYNWGPGRVDSQAAIPTQVRKYVSRVLERRDLERGIRAAAGPLQCCSLLCPACGSSLEVRVCRAERPSI